MEHIYDLINHEVKDLERANVLIANNAYDTCLLLIERDGLFFLHCDEYPDSFEMDFNPEQEVKYDLDKWIEAADEEGSIDMFNMTYDRLLSAAKYGLSWAQESNDCLLNQRALELVKSIAPEKESDKLEQLYADLREAKEEEQRIEEKMIVQKFYINELSLKIDKIAGKGMAQKIANKL